jgi:hypothetical protein
VAAIAKRHADSSAAALADRLAALSLGRAGSCSLTFRERMQAEEAAFLGALLHDVTALRGLVAVLQGLGTAEYAHV